MILCISLLTVFGVAVPPTPTATGPAGQHAVWRLQIPSVNATNLHSWLSKDLELDVWRNLRNENKSTATADISIPAAKQPAVAKHLASIGAKWTVMIDDLDALIAAQFEDMAAAAEVIFFLLFCRTKSLLTSELATGAAESTVAASYRYILQETLLYYIFWLISICLHHPPNLYIWFLNDIIVSTLYLCRLRPLQPKTIIFRPTQQPPSTHHGTIRWKISTRILTVYLQTTRLQPKW